MRATKSDQEDQKTRLNALWRANKHTRCFCVLLCHSYCFLLTYKNKLQFFHTKCSPRCLNHWEHSRERWEKKYPSISWRLAQRIAIYGFSLMFLRSTLALGSNPGDKLCGRGEVKGWELRRRSPWGKDWFVDWATQSQHKFQLSCENRWKTVNWISLFKLLNVNLPKNSWICLFNFSNREFEESPPTFYFKTLKFTILDFSATCHPQHFTWTPTVG